jgi:hypothetical protein
MDISAAQRRAKLAKLMEIEAYSDRGIGTGRSFRLSLPRHLHERGMRLHLRPRLHGPSGAPQPIPRHGSTKPF